MVTEKHLALASPAESSDPAGAVGLRALFDAHYDFVWRSVRRLGVDAAAADDAAQEVFLVAARRLAEIRPGSERAFLFGTALRVASDSRRSHARRGGRHEQVIEALPDPSPLPDELLERRRARRLLDVTIQAIPMDLRAVFVLFELEGMSMVEIAACLDLAPGTVASRLRRAREKFHEEVKRLHSQGERRRRA